MDEKTATKQRTLFKGVVDRDCWLRNDMHIVDIGGDANDALRRPGRSASGFQYGIAPEYVPIDRVLIGNIRCARVWLMTATSSLLLTSSSLKSRPAIMGTP